MTPEFATALPFLSGAFIGVLLLFYWYAGRQKWEWVDMEPGEFLERYRLQVVVALFAIAIGCQVMACAAKIAANVVQ